MAVWTFWSITPGVELEKSLEKLTVADWDRVMNVNLRGAFLLTQAVVPLFPESGGAIVNISSIHASHAFPDSIPYACSKAGMVALTRNLALELSSRHIRVNCICPGYIDTRLWEEYLRNSANPRRCAEQTTALHPLGRRGMPADVSEAALFLASDSFRLHHGHRPGRGRWPYRSRPPLAKYPLAESVKRHSFRFNDASAVLL